MQFNILTLFPDSLTHYTAASILGRAQAAGLININLINIRDFANDKHKQVDDTPYGGGPGMILKIEPIDRALKTLAEERGKKRAGKKLTIVLSARGQQFTQTKAAAYAKLNELTLICGRYEGIDQRVADHLADEELSIGPYVLSGGELPALVVIETVARLLPGVLGNPESIMEESFSQSSVVSSQLSVEFPQYTKPEEYRGWQVPPVLLSGNHEKIKTWRNN